MTKVLLSGLRAASVACVTPAEAPKAQRTLACWKSTSSTVESIVTKKLPLSGHTRADRGGKGKANSQRILGDSPLASAKKIRFFTASAANTKVGRPFRSQSTATALTGGAVSNTPQSQALIHG